MRMKDKENEHGPTARAVEVKLFITWSGHQPGCENWNLVPKNGIQKLLAYFLHAMLCHNSGRHVILV